MSVHRRAPGRDSSSQRRRLSARLTVAAIVWSLGLVLAALLVPVYNGQTTSSSQGLTLTTSTLVAVNGVRALILVVIPVIVSLVVAASIFHRHRRGAAWTTRVAWTAIGLLTAVCVLGIFTIGAFMVPVVVMLALSVRLDPGFDVAPGAPPRGLATES